jgi:hypothetical protein
MEPAVELLSAIFHSNVGNTSFSAAGVRNCTTR